MEDILLMISVLIFGVIGYFYMGKVNKHIEENTKQQDYNIVVIYDEDYEELKEHDYDHVLFVEKNQWQSFPMQFQYVVLCTADDYYNIVTNYYAKRDLIECKVYAICNDSDYLKLYHEKNIETLHSKEEVIALLDRLYEKNI